MKKAWIGSVAILAITLSAGAAKADDIHICSTSANCVGNPGSLQPTSSTTAYLYGKTYSPVPDTLFVIQFAPVADLSGNWNSSSQTVWSVLNENLKTTFNDTYPNLSSALSQLSGVGFSGQSFQVSDFQICVSAGCTWPGAADTGPISFTLPGGPQPGDIYVAFLEDNNGQVTAASPWSSGVVFTPEPGSLALLATGLLGLAPFIRRKFSA